MGVGVEQFEGGTSGGHGQRVPGQGAGLVDATQRGEVVHDVPASAEGTDREPAADDLAEAP
ncbi:uncharacterized protein METZ01_LOCUS216702, partial [marine metagenome]